VADLKTQSLGVALLSAGLFCAQAWAMEGDDQAFSSFAMHQNEVRLGARSGYTWELEGWYGGDYEKIVIACEGETRSGDGVEEAEIQLSYSWLITDFFDAQVGLRHDLEPHPARTHAVFALEGMAPQYIELAASVFLSEKGDVSARLEVERDFLITQRLIFQPLLELNFSAQDVEEFEIEAGLVDLELGLRLRYEIAREFAPYVGLVYERDLFATETRRREHGEDTKSWFMVAGIWLAF